MTPYIVGARVRLASTREIDNAALTLGIRSVSITHGLKLGDEGVVVSNAWNLPKHEPLFKVRFVRTNQTVICNAAMVAPFGSEAPTPQWTNDAPTEPGWYWFRWGTQSDDPRPKTVRLSHTAWRLRCRRA